MSEYSGFQPPPKEPGGSNNQEGGTPQKDTSYYGQLGVPKDASQDEIKREFRRKARELHPDFNRDDPDAGGKFIELQKIYTILHDPALRKQYDAGNLNPGSSHPDSGVGRPTTPDDIGAWLGIDPDTWKRIKERLEEQGKGVEALWEDINDAYTARDADRVFGDSETEGVPEGQEPEYTDQIDKTKGPGGGLRRLFSSVFRRSGEKGHQEAPKVTQEDMTRYTKFVVDTLNKYSHIHPPADSLRFILPNGKEIFVAFKDPELNWSTNAISGKKYVIGEMRQDPDNNGEYNASGIEVIDSSSGFQISRVTGKVKPDQFKTFGSDSHFGDREKWQYPNFEDKDNKPVKPRDLRKLTGPITRIPNR